MRTPFKLKGMDFGNSPVLKHDGTTSSTTHYADGSPKSKREVDFSKRHEDEKSGSAKVYEYRLIAADGKTVVKSAKGATPPKWFADYKNKPGTDEPTKSVIPVN